VCAPCFLVCCIFGGACHRTMEVAPYILFAGSAACETLHFLIEACCAPRGVFIQILFHSGPPNPRRQTPNCFFMHSKGFWATRWCQWHSFRNCVHISCFNCLNFRFWIQFVPSYVKHTIPAFPCASRASKQALKGHPPKGHGMDVKQSLNLPATIWA